MFYDSHNKWSDFNKILKPDERYYPTIFNDMLAMIQLLLHSHFVANVALKKIFQKLFY